jgi:hypothetical protein
MCVRNQAELSQLLRPIVASQPRDGPEKQQQNGNECLALSLHSLPKVQSVEATSKLWATLQPQPYQAPFCYHSVTTLLRFLPRLMAGWLSPNTGLQLRKPAHVANSFDGISATPTPNSTSKSSSTTPKETRYLGASTRYVVTYTVRLPLQEEMPQLGYCLSLWSLWKYMYHVYSTRKILSEYLLMTPWN